MELSIIIPCYNCESNIIQLLSDIECQLLSHRGKKTEIILIDDGSTDSTNKIISDFILNKPSFVLLVQKNLGAAIARENGLKIASGRFIFFCDSDDKISSNFFSYFYSLKIDFDILYFSSNIISPIDQSIIDDKICFNNEVSDNRPVEVFSKLLTSRQWTAAVWTYIFKRDLINKYNANFTTRKVHEDHLFTLKVLFAASVIHTSPEVLYSQVHTMGSLTNSKKSFNYAWQRFVAYKEASCFLKDKISKNDRLNYSEWSIFSIFNILDSDSFRNNNRITALFFKFFFFFLDFFMFTKVIFRRLKDKFLH